jgi:hypothetical protein
MILKRFLFLLALCLCGCGTTAAKPDAGLGDLVCPGGTTIAGICASLQITCGTHIVSCGY